MLSESCLKWVDSPVLPFPGAVVLDFGPRAKAQLAGRDLFGFFLADSLNAASTASLGGLCIKR